MTSAIIGERKSWLERVIDVRPEEKKALLSAFFCAATMFTAYSILRPVRETMGITSGVRNLPILFWATFAAMLVVQPLYGWMVSRFPLKVILPRIYMLFASMLVGFYAWFFLEADHSWIARVYFVWVSVFNLFIVAVFWSLMADVFDTNQAARLFGVIASGISVGGLIGPALAATLVSPIGTMNLLLVSAVLLVISALLMRAVINQKERIAVEPVRDGADEPPARGSAWGAFKQVMASPYLLGLSAFVLMLTSASTLLYLEQQRIVSETITDKDAQTSLFATIDFWVQAGSLIAQIFIFSRVLRWFGLTFTISSVPLVLLAAFAVLTVSSSLPVIIGAMMIRRVGEYGFTRRCRDILFTVLSRDEKYKAKNLIDTFIYRGGDALSASAYAGLVALLGSASSEAVISGIAGIVVCLVWLALSVRLAKRFNSARQHHVLAH